MKMVGRIFFGYRFRLSENFTVSENYFQSISTRLEVLAPSLLNKCERAQGVGERRYEYDNSPDRRCNRLDGFYPPHLYPNLFII